MAIPATAPIVVPKVRTTNLGGQLVTRETLTVDVQAQGLADLHWMLRRIAANETADQIRLQNPPSEVVVDNRPARGFDEAQKKVVVLYGARLATVAMRLIETTLRQNILATTYAQSGRLQNISGAWRWKLIQPGRGVRVITSANDLPTFVRGTILVLEPFSVPHATRVNQLVKGTGKFNTSSAPKPGKRSAGRPRKAGKPLGFLGETVRALRSRAEFRQFAMTVAFSKTHQVAGELSRVQGTGSIVLQLKRR